MLADSELLTELLHCQLAGSVQHWCRNAVLASNPAYHLRGKGLAFGTSAACLVEGPANLVVGLLLRHLSQFFHEGFRIAPAIGGFRGQLDREVFDGTSLPAQMQDSLVGRQLLLQGDIFEQQP